MLNKINLFKNNFIFSPIKVQINYIDVLEIYL